jgi:hypothetical protein
LRSDEEASPAADAREPLSSTLSWFPHSHPVFPAIYVLFRAKFAYLDGTLRAYPSGMDSGYYAAGTALVTSTQQMDTIANNLANASTVGYRAEKDIFSSVLADASNADASSLDKAINNYGIMSGTILDQSQGALQKTGNDLDVAISGPGYFVVQTANGPMYTRNGSFQV